MDGDILAQGAYLALFGLLLAAGYWTQAKANLGRTMQYAAIWVLIFIGVIAAFGLWGDIERHMGRQAVSSDGSEISVPRARDGHYYITLTVNRTPVEFVIDTGATDIVLNAQTARRIGVDTDALRYLGRAYTANGEVETAFIRLETIELGGMTDSKVAAVVSKGELFAPLLGMTYLQRFGRIEIADNVLTLRR